MLLSNYILLFFLNKSYQDEPVARHSVRRIPQSARGMGSTRVRRAINFRYRAAKYGQFNYIYIQTVVFYGLKYNKENKEIPFLLVWLCICV